MLVENENCVYFYDGRFGIMMLVELFSSCSGNREPLLEANWLRCSSAAVGLLFRKHCGCTDLYVPSRRTVLVLPS